MRQIIVTFLLFTGLLLYCVLHITGGFDIAYVKCFYLLPCFLYFSSLLWDCRNKDAACFTGHSALTVFFFILLLVNFGVIQNPYYTLSMFLGLTFVILLTRLRNE